MGKSEENDLRGGLFGWSGWLGGVGFGVGGAGGVFGDVFNVGGGDGFALVGEQRGKGGVFESFEAGDDGVGDDVGSGGVGMVMVEVIDHDLFAAHFFVFVRGEIGQVEDGNMQFGADVLGPLGVAAIGGATFDFVVLGIVAVLLLGDGGIAKGGVGVGPDIAVRDGQKENVGAFRLGVGGHFGHIPAIGVGVLVELVSDGHVFGFIADAVGGGAIIDPENFEDVISSLDFGEDARPVAGAVVIG